jgi:SAM-dependent methyltransferase
MNLVSNEEIENIYNTFVVKDESYFRRFETPFLYFSSSEEEKSYPWKGNLHQMDVPRVMSLIDYKEWIKKYDIFKGQKLLYTCPSDPELDYLQYEKTTLIEYPPHDLHTLDIPEKDHDLVIFNQTIEHLYSPFLAISRIKEHLKTGGFLYTTVPTINIPHMTPFHFNGYTPVGLCVLMRVCGFKILECGHWGSKDYIDYIFSNNYWPGCDQLMRDGKVAVSCDSVCQAQTWVLAKKE